MATKKPAGNPAANQSTPTGQPTKPATGPRKPHVVAHGRPDAGTELDGLRQQVADLARRLDALEKRTT